MKKILFIGPYRQNDEAGRMARSYCMSLIATGHDITLRPLFTSNNISKDIDASLQDKESTKYKEYDICIQNAPYPMLMYDDRFKINIALISCGYSGSEYTEIAKHVNLMDCTVVPSDIDKQNLINAGVYKPIHKIPMSVSTNRFERSYHKMPLPINDDDFIFYCMDEYTYKTNMGAILSAFHTEFHPTESTQLLLSVYRKGMSELDLKNLVNKEFNTIKAALRLYKNLVQYKNELLITETVEPESLSENILHNTGHCFISTHYNGNCNNDILNAIGFQKTPIVMNATGAAEYVGDGGYLVDSYKTPILSPDINAAENDVSARQHWNNVDVLDLRRKMRLAFNNSDKSKATNCLENIYNLTHDKIAQIWTNILQ